MGNKQAQGGNLKVVHCPFGCACGILPLVHLFVKALCELVSPHDAILSVYDEKKDTPHIECVSRR